MLYASNEDFKYRKASSSQILEVTTQVPVSTAASGWDPGFWVPDTAPTKVNGGQPWGAGNVAAPLQGPCLAI